MPKNPLLLLFFSILLISCSKESEPEAIELIHHGDVLLLNQQEVDAFAKEGYTKIDGFLGVGGMGDNDIVSVAGLSSLTEVKDLAVKSTMLTSLEGLHNLTSVAQMFIFDNSRLKAIDHLSLQEITTQALGIVKNNSLEDISGFEKLQGEIHSVRIDNNPLLTSLKGLEGLEAVETRLQIENNANLENLHPLAGLTTVEEVDIINNAKLKNLIGLENIQTSSWVDISDNENLVSLEGLNGLTSLTEYMTIEGNKNLSDFCGLGNLLSQPNSWYFDVRISDNFINPSQEELIDGSCSL